MKRFLNFDFFWNLKVYRKEKRDTTIKISVSFRVKLYDTWVKKTSLSKTHEVDENQQNKCKHLYL